MLELAWSETTSWVAELEWPKEVAGLLEVWSDSVDLVDEVLHADNTVLAKVLLDDGVVGQRNALLLSSLCVTALVNELADRLEVWVSVCDKWLNDLQHLSGCLGQSNENAIVDLEKSEKLESLSLLWVDLVDTLDANNEDELWFSWDVVAALRLGYTGKSNLLALCIAVLLDVRLSTLEDLLALLLVLLLRCQQLSNSI